MKYAIGIILLICAISIAGVRKYESIGFDKNVTGYLKRAADANTVELASGELTKAITYLEENNITTGYTSIWYETPDEDIDFWYRNLKASQNELQNLENAGSLEKTNVLIKLRETLVDQGKKTKVTIPKGIAVYPENTKWAILMSFAAISFIFGLILLIPKEKDSSCENPSTS